jgi:hypothetical protein
MDRQRVSQHSRVVQTAEWQSSHHRDVVHHRSRIPICPSPATRSADVRQPRSTSNNYAIKYICCMHMCLKRQIVNMSCVEGCRTIVLTHGTELYPQAVAVRASHLAPKIGQIRRFRSTISAFIQHMFLLPAAYQSNHRAVDVHAATI